MTTPKEPDQTLPSKLPINKRELVADVIAFTSVVGAYFFISITLHVKFFKNLLGCRLDDSSLIVELFLSYACLIFILKFLSFLFQFRFKRENSISKAIDNEVNSSLLIILAIGSIHILLGEKNSLQKFCHLAIWLWIGETARIIGSFVGKALDMYSLAFWGLAMEIILFLGAISSIFEASIFDLF